MLPLGGRSNAKMKEAALKLGRGNRAFTSCNCLPAEIVSQTAIQPCGDASVLAQTCDPALTMTS